MGMLEMDRGSPSARVATALVKIIEACVPDEFDFILLIEQRGTGDVSIESCGYEPDDAIEVLSSMLDVMRSNDPIVVDEGGR